MYRSYMYTRPNLVSRKEPLVTPEAQIWSILSEVRAKTTATCISTVSAHLNQHSSAQHHLLRLVDALYSHYQKCTCITPHIHIPYSCKTQFLRSRDAELLQCWLNSIYDIWVDLLVSRSLLLHCLQDTHCHGDIIYPSCCLQHCYDYFWFRHEVVAIEIIHTLS